MVSSAYGFFVELDRTCIFFCRELAGKVIEICRRVISEVLVFGEQVSDGNKLILANGSSDGPPPFPSPSRSTSASTPAARRARRHPSYCQCRRALRRVPPAALLPPRDAPHSHRNRRRLPAPAGASRRAVPERRRFTAPWRSTAPPPLSLSRAALLPPPQTPPLERYCLAVPDDVLQLVDAHRGPALRLAHCDADSPPAGHIQALPPS
jgi:hypothetical protein